MSGGLGYKVLFVQIQVLTSHQKQNALKRVRSERVAARGHNKCYNDTASHNNDDKPQ